MTIFAVSLQYTADSEHRRSELLPSHREWVGGLKQAGRLLEAGPVIGRAAALLIVEFGAVDELLAEFDRDPFWMAGVVESRVADEWTPRWGVLAP